MHTHAEALEARGDEDGARRSIGEARERLLAFAAEFEDPAHGELFLTALPANARTMALAEKWLGPPAAGG